ncbi:MAG: aldolase [Actinomycetia bacterium]|nr:aldolase [Actinomycetes bacterium]MCP4223753.1 aldolase [Actinomycetes bacterium]MCP5032011.1 aldolase [Actinomycetes bacterium]
MKDNGLKTIWASGGAALGLWLGSANAAGAEQLGALRYDYINIDLQHGLIDYSQAVTLLQAMQSSSATLTCRVPWNEPGIIGKVLDAGAQGVIIPMVNTVAEAEAAVSACLYAPRGSRSFGPIRAARSLGRDYATEANDKIVCIPMIETVEAMSNLDDILDVPGIDAVYIGPADLSISLGLPPGSNNAEESFQDALATVVSACQKRGIIPGIHSVPEWAPTRLEQGFRMVTVTSDLQALGEGAKVSLDSVNNASPGASKGEMY